MPLSVIELLKDNSLRWSLLGVVAFRVVVESRTDELAQSKVANLEIDSVRLVAYENIGRLQIPAGRSE